MAYENITVVESGTFIPTLSTIEDFNNNVSYTNQFGRWTRINNVVECKVIIETQNRDRNDVTELRLRGMPYTFAEEGQCSDTFHRIRVSTSPANVGNRSFCAVGVQGTNEVYFEVNTSNAGVAIDPVRLVGERLSNPTFISFNFTYFTDDPALQ